MKKDIIAIILVSIFLIILPFLLFAYLFVKTIDSDKDFCLDTGICKEGLELNTEHGRIKINKENCLKHNWQWNAETKTCRLR